MRARRKAPALPLPVVDLSALPPERRKGEARRRLHREADRAFDLGAGCLLRGLLVVQGTDDRVLSLLLHHLAGDGWSTGVLARELIAGYAGEIGVAAAQPEPLPFQVPDYAAWQRRRLDGAPLERL